MRAMMAEGPEAATKRVKHGDDAQILTGQHRKGRSGNQKTSSSKDEQLKHAAWYEKHFPKLEKQPGKYAIPCLPCTQTSLIWL